MKVQQYNPAGNVRTAPIQNRRLNQVDSGVSDLGQSIQGTGQQMFNQAVQNQREVDIDTAEEKLAQYDKAYIEAMHGEGGYLTKSGKDAFEGKESVTQAMKEYRKELMSNMTPDQAKLFDKSATRVDNSYLRTIYTHAENGRKAWSMATQQAHIENAVEKGAYNFRNDDQILENLAVIRESTLTLADQEGMDGKVAQERLETATSKYFASVIGRASKQDPETAERLIEKYGKNMEVGDLDQVKSQLEGYKRDQQSMSLANSWMDASLDTTQAREQAERIKDPNLRKQAMDEFKLRKAERDNAEQESRLDLFNDFSSQIENGDVNYSQIPREDRDFMTHGQRQALQALEKQRISGSQVQEMPFDLRMKMDELIGKDKLGEAKKVLSENYHKMTKQDRKEYSDAVNKGMNDPEVYRLQTFKETTKQYAKDLSDDDKNQYFYAAEKWRQNYIKTNDKEPSPEEERKQLAWLLINEDGWDYGDRFKEPDIINKQVLQDHVEQLNSVRASKGLPPANRQQIEELDKRLKQRGYYLD